MSMVGRAGSNWAAITLVGLAVGTIGCAKNQQADTQPPDRTSAQPRQRPLYPHLTAFVRDTVNPRALDDVVLNELAQALEADPQVRAANMPLTAPDRVGLLQGALARLDSSFDSLLLRKLQARGFPIQLTQLAAVWIGQNARSLPGWTSNDYQALVSWSKGAYTYGGTFSIRTPLSVVDTLSDAYFTNLQSFVNLAYVFADLGIDTAVAKGYDPLGIPPYAGCLYANSTNAFFTAAPCSESLPVAPTGVKMLKVNRVSYNSVPPVSRWEWSTSKRVNTVGVRCGTAWCEIVPTDFGPGDPEREDPQDPEPTRPRFATKPWYDFQRLGDSTPIQPRGPRGRIRPAPGIAQLNDSISPVQDRFLDVAIVWLYGAPPQNLKYAKMGLRNGRNVVSICHGSRTACRQDAGNPANFPDCAAVNGNTYFSRIDTVYGCPIYTYEGGGRPFILTTRWAWDPADEGMWIRCPEGCCQEKGLLFGLAG